MIERLHQPIASSLSWTCEQFRLAQSLNNGTTLNLAREPMDVFGSEAPHHKHCFRMIITPPRYTTLLPLSQPIVDTACPCRAKGNFIVPVSGCVYLSPSLLGINHSKKHP